MVLFILVLHLAGHVCHILNITNRKPCIGLLSLFDKIVNHLVWYKVNLWNPVSYRYIRYSKLLLLLLYCILEMQWKLHRWPAFNALFLIKFFFVVVIQFVLQHAKIEVSEVHNLFTCKFLKVNCLFHKLTYIFLLFFGWMLSCGCCWCFFPLFFSFRIFFPWSMTDYYKMNFNLTQSKQAHRVRILFKKKIFEPRILSIAIYHKS